MSHPSTYTDEIFDAICEQLENGKVLKDICKDPEMPDRSTVQRWIAADDGRRRKYEAARKACVEFWADEIIEIATDGSKDTVTDEKGRVRCDHEWVSRSRLRIDTIKFLMMKIAPRVYGDRLPETIEARAMDLEEQQQAQRRTSVTKLEFVIVEPGSVVQDANGNWVPSGNDPRDARIAELEAQLAGRTDAPAPPALLEYDPGPLPARMDKDIASSMVQLIKAYVRRDDQRPPETVLDEVLSVCRQALALHYRADVEIAESSRAIA